VGFNSGGTPRPPKGVVAPTGKIWEVVKPNGEPYFPKKPKDRHLKHRGIKKKKTPWRPREDGPALYYFQKPFRAPQKFFGIRTLRIDGLKKKIPKPILKRYPENVEKSSPSNF